MTTNSNATAPYLRKNGTATQLIVDGAPFLVRGGELMNSSSSNLDYMQPIWERMTALKLNTVLAAVSWELIEPEEGQFDFTLVDGLLRGARQHGLRLILLWFGSWKNGMSSYIPLWVKRDTARFPRATIAGKTAEVLSPLAEANWQADARAFAALMQHLKQADAGHHTVIMVQVENEVGILGDSRDRSELAERAFAAPVPQELLDDLVRHRDELGDELRAAWEQAGWPESGTWEQIFGAGPATDERFMAWQYARSVDQVAAAGKAAYELPLFVNAWLSNQRPEHLPGDWPSGGPLPQVFDMWLAGAPHIDILTPDIYEPNFEEWCQRYVRRGNPLFIPEMRWLEPGDRQVLYAIGQHDAIGTSPFAIDALLEPATAALRNSYAALEQLQALIVAHQGLGVMAGFLFDEQHPRVTRTLGEYELEISLDEIFHFKAEIGYGLVIATGPDTFVGAGRGFKVTFRPLTDGPALAGIAAVDEGQFHNGVWVPGRRLNGDETAQGAAWRFGNHAIAIQQCRVYRYE